MNGSITIVDDSDEFRFLIALLLEEELGVDCTSLASLADLQAQSGKVLASKAILLDINLGPGNPDGIAAYDWLKSQNYLGDVFFLTGHAKGSPQALRASQTGVRVWEKPMAPDEIVHLLKETLNGAKGAPDARV